ncbi:MAG: LysR family transcriptional regulator, partial [Azovibrio sp.]|nr:LysR family transcriptional regulator [Azovibrio sp.]
MKVTLRQLEVFAAVASHGQVTRAADAVALSQAAASMALADLERQLDGRLFDRVGRQLLLNEQGRRLLPRAL